MKKINFLPLPFPGESPTSLIRRLMLGNGYSTDIKFDYVFLTKRGYKNCPLLEGSRYEDFMLSQVTGPLQEKIREGFYRLENSKHETGDFYIKKILVPRRILRTKQSAICTDCLTEGWECYIKDFWITEHCPLHHKTYISCCPECSRPFFWPTQLLPLCPTCNKRDRIDRFLKSPECTEEQSLPEQRLLAIVQSGNQEHFDRLVSIMKNLGLNLASQKIYREVFEAATSIVFEDLQGAAQALSVFIHANDNLDIAILKVKLEGLTPSYFLDSICTHLKTSEQDGALAEPGFLLDKDHLLKLLNISWRDWLNVRDFWGLSGMFASHTENHYSKSEISQIAHVLHFYPEVLQQGKAAKAEKLRLDFLSYESISQILDLPDSTVRYLGQQGYFGTSQRNSKSTKFYERQEVESIADKYISVNQLSKDLNTPKSSIQTAIRLNIDSIDAIEGIRLFALINKSDTWIIQKEIALLDSAKKDAKSRRLCYVDEAEDVIHINEASKELGICIAAISAYRDIGAIKCHPAKHYLLSSRDVSRFETDYATPTVLAKELEIPRRRVFNVLEKYTIFPISGPLIDGKMHPLYRRSDFPPNLKELINSQQGTFGFHFKQGTLITQEKAALQLGLSWADIAKIFSMIIRPSRPKHYRHKNELTPEEIIKISEFIQSLTALEQLLDEINISLHSFSLRFIGPKYVTPITLSSEKFLNESDTVKIRQFMSHYCTLNEATRILSTSKGAIQVLIKKGLLKPTYVSGYHYQHPVLKISDVNSVHGAKMANRNPTKTS